VLVSATKSDTLATSIAGLGRRSFLSIRFLLSRGLGYRRQSLAGSVSCEALQR
jgi:hypothetical protein